jgi:hypothetical protein
LTASLFPDGVNTSSMPAPHVVAASTCHPCNQPRIAFARHAQELIFPFASHHLHAAACHRLVMPCLAVLLAGLLHAAACLLCCMSPKLPKPPRLLLSVPVSSSAVCSWSCAVPELSVHPRARAHYHHCTSHPCAGPNRTDLVRRDPGAAFPAPPSSSPCYPLAPPSDAAPNHGPESHAESPSCHACCLLRRESASTPTACLWSGPPLLRPP